MTVASDPDVRQRRTYARAASSFDKSDLVVRKIEAILLEHLDPIRIQPRTILDLGCGTGRSRAALLARHPRAHYLALDAVPAMLARVRGRWPWQRPTRICADARHLPLADHSIDLVFCNLSLSACSDLPAALAEAARVLCPGGLLLISVLGPDSLLELRQAWAAVGGEARVPPFADMHDIGDMLVRGGLGGVVVDCERLSVTYPDGVSMLDELQGLGLSGRVAGSRQGLCTARRRQRVAEALPVDSAGRRPLGLELVFAHAWAPERARSQSVHLSPG